MKSTALFKTLIAVCCIGGVIATASAKSAGGGGAAGVRGGMRAGGPASFHKIRPVFARGFAARRAFGHTDLRRQQGSVLPYWPSYGNSDPFYYYPPADVALAQGAVSSVAAGEPVAPSQVPPNRILVVQPGCRTQDQKVHSEAGEERIVHITRCY